MGRWLDRVRSRTSGSYALGKKETFNHLNPNDEDKPYHGYNLAELLSALDDPLDKDDLIADEASRYCVGKYLKDNGWNPGDASPLSA